MTVLKSTAIHSGGNGFVVHATGFAVEVGILVQMTPVKEKPEDLGEVRRIDKIVYAIAEGCSLDLFWNVDGLDVFICPLAGRGVLPFDTVMGVPKPQGADGHIYGRLSVTNNKKTFGSFFVGFDLTK